MIVGSHASPDAHDAPEAPDAPLTRSCQALSIAAPELGAKTLYTNLGRAADQTDTDVFALILNPQD